MSELDLASKADGDCGCGGGGGAAEVGDAGQAPSVQDVDRLLAELIAEDDGAELTLALATLDADLESTEDLELEAAEPADAPNLAEILAVAERFPGLKITFSY